MAMLNDEDIEKLYEVEDILLGMVEIFQRAGTDGLTQQESHQVGDDVERILNLVSELLEDAEANEE